MAIDLLAISAVDKEVLPQHVNLRVEFSAVGDRLISHSLQHKRLSRRVDRSLLFSLTMSTLMRFCFLTIFLGLEFSYC